MALTRQHSITSSDDLVVGWLHSKEAAFVLQANFFLLRLSLRCISAINGPQGQWRAFAFVSGGFAASFKSWHINLAVSACPSAFNNSTADIPQFQIKFLDALLSIRQQYV
jgi:hypothetical protein